MFEYQNLGSMKSVASMVVASAGVGFLAYCVYFDHKRRNAPDFAAKRREQLSARRRKLRSDDIGTLPDLADTSAMQEFFLKHIQEGETCLAKGQVFEGINHMSYAIAVCSQPKQLMELLQQTLEPKVFNLLRKEIPIAKQRILGSQMNMNLRQPPPSLTVSSGPGHGGMQQLNLSDKKTFDDDLE